MFEAICTTMGAGILLVAMAIVAARALIGLYHLLFKDE